MLHFNVCSELIHVNCWLSQSKKKTKKATLNQASEYTCIVKFPLQPCGLVHRSPLVTGSRKTTCVADCQQGPLLIRKSKYILKRSTRVHIWLILKSIPIYKLQLSRSKYRQTVFGEVFDSHLHVFWRYRHNLEVMGVIHNWHGLCIWTQEYVSEYKLSLMAHLYNGYLWMNLQKKRERKRTIFA